MEEADSFKFATETRAIVVHLRAFGQFFGGVQSFGSSLLVVLPISRARYVWDECVWILRLGKALTLKRSNLVCRFEIGYVSTPCLAGGLIVDARDAYPNLPTCSIKQPVQGFDKIMLFIIVQLSNHESGFNTSPYVVVNQQGIDFTSQKSCVPTPSAQ